VETRPLGRTGHRSSLAVLGGIAFHFTDGLDEAVALLRSAADAGVNHLDIAPGYMTAEEKAGRALAEAPEVADDLFVAGKSAERTAAGVRADLERSLARLGRTSFDLYQLHGVVSLDDLDERAAAGVVDELLRIRDEGLCRWVGTTGHDLGTPTAQAEAVRRYDLDTVMFPVNPRLWGDPAYRRDAEALLDLCAERQVGVMAIKAAAARPWAAARADRHATTWYEPYTAADEIERGVRFALSAPGVAAFCTPGDVRLLRTALDAAARFVPMDDGERRDAVAAVAHEPALFPLPAA
jgi:aryl-alcohol dehydrogenase-like predicted oxidoreductase